MGGKSRIHTRVIAVVVGVLVIVVVVKDESSPCGQAFRYVGTYKYS